MSYESDQRRTISDMLPKTSFCFATVDAVDIDNRLLKVTVEPYGIETGWCSVLRGQWLYDTGQEVLVGVVRGDHDTEQYVVLGAIDKGVATLDERRD